MRAAETRSGEGWRLWVDSLKVPSNRYGLPETEGSVQVKINRGTFPAWFMVVVMKAIGAHALRLD